VEVTSTFLFSQLLFFFALVSFLLGQNRKEREQKKNPKGMKNNKGIKLKEMDKLFQLQIQLDYSSHLCSQVHVSCLAFTLYCFFFFSATQKRRKKKAQLTT
jgi:preprotein translocase subunit YajC